MEKNIGSRVLLVCCDIVGTYSSNDPLIIEKRIRMLRELDSLRKSLNLDYILFSFISTLECNHIYEYCNSEEKQGLQQLVDLVNKKYGTRILCSYHYGCDGVIRENDIYERYTDRQKSKAEQIVENIERIEFRSYRVKELLYIDDNPHINLALLFINPKFIQMIKQGRLDFKVICNNENALLYLCEKIDKEIDIYNCKEKKEIDFVIDGINRINKKYIKRKE